MPIHRTIIIASTLAIASSASSALTSAEVDVVCPIDGEPFKTIEAMSGTQFGMFLDLKPFGPIAAPWPIAKCPGNGFVIYKTPFSEDEISQLKPYVMAAEYQTLQHAETNYYLAARLQRVLKEPAGTIAFTLLRATWEARTEDQYNVYAAEALAAYKAALELQYTDRKQWLTDQLVAAELERRLGRFDEAKSRLSMLAGLGDLTDLFLRSIVDLQTKLVAEQDARPTKIPRPSK